MEKSRVAYSIYRSEQKNSGKVQTKLKEVRVEKLLFARIKEQMAINLFESWTYLSETQKPGEVRINLKVVREKK